MFSDSCTISDAAFGRFTIERCWEIWRRECDQELSQNISIDKNNSQATNGKKIEKVKYQYAVKIKKEIW